MQNLLTAAVAIGALRVNVRVNTIMSRRSVNLTTLFPGQA